MATCHGPESPYGCGHHAEHVRAARKGWTTRRRSRSFLSTRDAEDLKRVVGPTLEGHHVHRTKTGARKHLLKIEGAWFSMSQDEYKGLVRAGREGRKAEAREKKRAPRLAAKQARDDARYRAAQEREARAIERAEQREVYDIIKKRGGIRRAVGGGKEHEHSEYNTYIPKSLRYSARKQGLYGHKGLTPDQAATEVHQHMPWLHIETPSDLYDYFERLEDRRYARGAA